MIAIVDYGIGNLRSVEKALHHVTGRDDSVVLTADPRLIEEAAGLVLPGVGAFGACASALRHSGFEPLIRRAADEARPLLGICVGMQLLFERSEEMGTHQGLGLLPGVVRRFPEPSMGDPGGGHAGAPEAARTPRLKVPQIGWNQLWHDGQDPLLAHIMPGSYAYFVHSYYCQPSDPLDVVALTDYGLDYASIVRRRGTHIWGAQFHPEKSQRVGLQILRNYVNQVCRQR